MNLAKTSHNRHLRLTVLYISLALAASVIRVDMSHAQGEFSWEMFLPAIVNSTSGLSHAQKAFIRQIGYPQQFTRTFSSEGAKERVDECWVYTKYGVVECFINGIFVKESSFSGNYADLPPSRYRPQRFRHQTTIQDIVSRYGQPSSINQETIWNGVLKIYAYPFIYLVFNNDQLVSVTALR